MHLPSLGHNFYLTSGSLLVGEELNRIAADIILLSSLILLGIGYFLKDRRKHHLRSLGWILFGVYWLLHAPYYMEINDGINAFFCVMALPFGLALTYQEYLSYKWEEDFGPLRFWTGVAFVAGIPFFIVDRVPLITGYLTRIVAGQSAWLLNMFGYGYTLGGTDYAGNSLWYKTVYSPEINTRIYGINQDINIILACTAIQAALLVFAIVILTNADRKRKALTFGITVPTIYIMNLVRNALVIYLFDIKGWDFDFAHNYVGKIAISGFTLFFLLLVAFSILPELYDNVSGMFDLPWRKKPKHETRERFFPFSYISDFSGKEEEGEGKEGDEVEKEEN